MTKRPLHSFAVLLLPSLLTGCGVIGSKSASLSIVYAAAALAALVLLVWYCLSVEKKDGWFLLLLSSVMVVDLGYFSLSISTSLEEALLANRISYLGSVFLPMSMLMSILDVVRIRYKKWLPLLLMIVGLGVFFIAASPGYLPIYYQEASIATVGGITVLNKVYGPWHSLYLFYLLGYFVSMIVIIRLTAIRKKAVSTAHAASLAMAVLANICVWLIEQLVHINFEFLSISYIISELFLLSVHSVIEDQRRTVESAQETAMPAAAPAAHLPAETEKPQPEASEAPIPAPLPAEDPADAEDARSQFLAGLATLTQTERTILKAYLAGKTTREIMSELSITENTLKFHNKNLYGKLGVTSRKQLLELHRATLKL